MAGPFPHQTSEPARDFSARLLGAGAANPTKGFWRNAAITRVSIGRFRVVMAEKFGAFAGLAYFGLESSTPANVAGCTLVAGDFDAVTRTIDVYLYSGGTTPALRELAAGEKLNFSLRFTHG